MAKKNNRQYATVIVREREEIPGEFQITKGPLEGQWVKIRYMPISPTEKTNCLIKGVELAQKAGCEKLYEYFRIDQLMRTQVKYLNGDVDDWSKVDPSIIDDLKVYMYGGDGSLYLNESLIKNYLPKPEDILKNTPRN
jgi:hypothetical protein